MSVVVGHPAGTAFNRALLRGLVRAGLLDAFFTTIAASADMVDGLPWPRWLRAELRRRVFDGVPRHQIKTSVLRESLRIAGHRLRIRALVQPETGWACIERINKALAERLAAYIRHASSARAVYAYEDAALEAFRAARSSGRHRIYELPIVDSRTMHRLLSEERGHAPEWVDTVDGLKDSQAKLARKDEEIALAEHIVVPCEFARMSLQGAYDLDAQVHTVPYGAPPVAATEPNRRRRDERLRVVYVGQLTQRKGLSYLFDAIAPIRRQVELTLIGPRPMASCVALDRALDGHTWVPPLPHLETLARVREQHVMVFPSLCEGFGLVILEAMAQGVPVVTTTNTGGPDVIEDGVDGFVVPIRDPAAITERLVHLREDEAARLEMAHAAKRKASEWAWDRYEREMSDLLRSIAR